jgi:hypothetical protein
MRRSDSRNGALRSRRLVTAGWSLLVALGLLAPAVVVPLRVRDGRGERHSMTAWEIWKTALGDLPNAAPDALDPVVMSGLTIAAVVGLAWAIVAIWRLPR